MLGLTAAAWTWGRDAIDVFRVVSGAAESLLHGRNPYGPIYSVTVKNASHHVLEHFPYGPIVPILAAPGRLIGDVRVMSVVCVAAIVIGLWYLVWQGSHRPDAHRVLAIALAMPLSVGMIHESWVDVNMMVGIVWWLALQRDHRRWAVVALTIGMLAKPTALIILIPWFLWSRRSRVEIVAAAGAAVILALPFALMTGVGGFVYDVIGIQLVTPFRTDSLNLAAWLTDNLHVQFPSLLPVPLLLIATILIAWKGRPRVVTELALQAAILNVVAYIMAKQAFFNYYYISAVMLLVAMAGAGLPLLADDVALPWQGLVARLRGLRGEHAERKRPVLPC